MLLTTLPARVLRALACCSMLAVVVAAVVTSDRTIAEAAWSPPSFVRSMGATGRAGVYAWGLAHNPVSNEIIVSDYLNFRVRRYSVDGRHLGDLEERPGEPWSVATDPNSGDIYVMNNWDKRIERYDVAGNHIRSIGVDGGWYAWIDVDSRGRIWAIRGGPTAGVSPRLDHFDPNGNKLGQWAIDPPTPLTPTMYGIEVADDGRVFLNDSNNGLIHVYAADGSFERSFGDGYLSGDDQRGLTLDETNGWVYVSDASINRVVKFTMAGEYVASFSKTGDGPGEFNGPRQLAVDSEGDVWVADFGNKRFHEFAPDGSVLGTYPDPAQSPPDGHLAHAADSAVDPLTGAIWIADTYNQRFNRMNADGTPSGTWGRRGGTDGYGMNYPSTIGFDPILRRVWVGMEEGRHLKVYDENANYLFIVGDQTKTPESEGYLRNVTDVDFYGDKAFISDEYSHDVKVLDTATGEELYVLDLYEGTGWSGNHGLAIHPDTGDLFVAGYNLDQVSVFDQAGNLKYRFGSRGSGDGQFRSPRDVAIIDDVVYVSDAELSRIQAFGLDGTYLGRFGGWGDGPYNFRNPMGLDTANGLLYVTDVENSRVTVFDPAVPKPAFKWGRPTVTLEAPSDGQVIVGDQLNIAGTATDDDGLANIEVNVQRASTGLWWNGQTASWQADPYPNLALWMSPTAPATSATFDWFFPSIERGATYRIDVVARDRHGTTSLMPSSATVTIAESDLVDVVDPTAEVTSPLAGSVSVAGEPVAIRGTATDDVAVDGVDVAIRDTATSLWWSPTAGWGPLAWIPTLVSAPGTAATDWAFDWTPTASGQFEIHTRAVDLAGNSSPVDVVGFQIIDAGDTAPPDATVDVPVSNQPEALGPITISGTATDNSMIAGVDVSIRNNDSGQWLRSDGTWGGFARLPAALSAVNSPSTEWSFEFDPPTPGSYGLSVRAVDAAGNVDPTKPWVAFTVIEVGGDTTAPDAVVTSPTPNQTLPANSIVLTGGATDDTAVSEVAIALRRVDTGEWLRTDGTWGAFAWHPTTLSSPGTPTTDWTWSIDALTPGAYGFVVRTTDTSGNLDPSRPWVPFTTE